MKSLLRTRPAQAAIPALLGGYMSLALRTTRWTLDGQAHLAAHVSGHPAIFAFWHEFLPFMPGLVVLARKLPTYRPVRIHTLVSKHRDGRIIGAIVRRFGISTIQGSSSRGGAAGFRAMLAALARGELIGITPDGPRGPRREAAPGVAQLAALAGVPVVPCAARTSRSIQLDSWDRMTVPLPFGRAVVVCGTPIEVPRDRWEASLPAIADGLNQAAARAEALCPR
ncbi:MAG TPA: lysophospholipid acyltransferase family protein [Rhodopila sp.]|nr:lysophospholipid acyltransferase family protein [Rhodopila sp.]